MDMSSNGHYLSAEQAADYCRVSTKTVQRWLAAGVLKADKSGRAYRIAERDLEPFRRQATGDTPDTGQPRTSPTVDATPTTVDTEAPYLAALVRELHAQLLQATAAATLWQERAAVLEAQLAQRPALGPGLDETVMTDPAPRPWWRRWGWWQ
jgi:excisionase family DNA binding protein